MSDKLPNCPVCGMHELRTRKLAPEDGQMHYYVECFACGVEFHHGDFDGVKGVIRFFDDAGNGRCEDEGDDDWFRCSHCGHTHRYTPEELKDPDAFSFCPTCGFEVVRW